MEPLKNTLYSKDKIEQIASDIHSVDLQFDQKKFLKIVFANTWEVLELKERMRRISESLYKTFRHDFKKCCDILIQVAKIRNGFAQIAYSDFVQVYGLDKPEISIPALKQITICCSSEFAIRPFIRKYPDTIHEMKKWTSDSNEHIRRLASEGCRPRLPWGEALPEFKKDPTNVINILEQLKEDESEYVRKSVANNLNDISKDNPDIFISLMKKWYGKNQKTDWICKHASRTLFKQANPEILKLFGYTEPIELKNLTYKKLLSIGESFSFEVTLFSKKKTLCKSSYIIEYQTKSNKPSQKVYHLYDGEIISEKVISKSIEFTQKTTRKIYPGKHKLSIIVNGETKETKIFFVH